MFQIKQAVTEQDWQHVKTLLGELLAFEKTLRPQRKEAQDTINGAFSFVRDNIANHQGAAFLCFVSVFQAAQSAVDPIKPIAFVTGWVEGGDGLDVDGFHHGLICDAFVVPEWRRRGVLTQLIGAMENHFRAQGITKLSTYTLGANTVMQKTLEKQGFAVHRIVFEREVP